ncbi:MAG: rhodanese-like domain-containing protein [Nitrososphaerota archaeon]|jgi:rhodanese-related sulfurtransferase|nr:rhodanese-like domain-containing protein [Nitrososphaerota archaeon]
MVKNTVKKCLSLVTMALVLCLLAQMPLSVLGAEIQEPVIRNGVKYADVASGKGNSGSILGDEITANGAIYDITLNGKTVGSLVFNKNSQYIEIILTSNVAVDVLWNCASKYANCTLDGMGIYKIPQLLQDNGKTQSFNAMWITNVRQGTPGSYQNIAVHDAKQMMVNTQNIVILDVRNQSEYQLGHLYNAELIPLFALENKTALFAINPPSTNDPLMHAVYQNMLNSFHLSDHINDPIIVYCKAGSRSTLACELLAEQGYTQVYNMVDGITEWIKNDYTIYEPIHHVNVAVANGQTTTDIEHWLSYIEDCIPCQNIGENYATAPSMSYNDVVIQQSDDYLFAHTTVNIDGTVLEFDTESILLWQQKETASNFNRTTTLTLSTAESLEGETLQFYRLYVEVQHDDYSITISTFLEILDETTYAKSTTYMEYIPVGPKPVTTMEIVEFTDAVTLSQLFQSLAETVDNLGHLYEIAKENSLTVFAGRYYTLADEARLLSHTITTQLSTYDKPILFNTAVVVDISKSDWCSIICISAGIGICGAAYLFPPLFTLCFFYGDYIITYGCDFCGLINDIDQSQGTSGIAMPKWISSVQTASWYGSPAGVYSASNICGTKSDGNSAQIYAGSTGSQAVIVGVMSGPAKGDIWLYGQIALGTYTSYQVWVSNDGVNWGSNPIYSTSQSGVSYTPYNIYGGYASSTFNYISIACYNTGNTCNMYVDCVTTTA